MMNDKKFMVLALIITLVLASTVIILSFMLWEHNNTKKTGVGAAPVVGVDRDVMPFSGVQYNFDINSKNVTNVQPLGWTGMQWEPSTQIFLMNDVQNILQGNISTNQHVVPNTTFMGGAAGTTAPFLSTCDPGQIVTGFATYGTDGAAQGLQVVCKSIWDVDQANSISTLGTLDKVVADAVSGSAVKSEVQESWVAFANPGLVATSAGVLSATMNPKSASAQDINGAVPFLQLRDVYKPVVNDPTCTSVFLQTDGTRVNPQEMCTMTGTKFLAANTACTTQATTVCGALPNKGADDPYCACINATPIPGAATAMGLKPEQLPPRCLSNGACMSARFQDTWMSYLGVASDCCPALTVDICKVLLKMDPATIVHITNSGINCTGSVPNTCDRCTAGAGPCVATVSIDGMSACQPKQPDGTCAKGFEECSAPSPDPSPGKGDDNNVIPIAVGTVVGFLLMVIIIVVLSTR